MAHLWVREETAGPWAVLPLEADIIDLRQNPPRPVAAGEVAGDSAVALIRRGPASWAVMAAPDAEVAVNGWPLATGLHAARDRDELRVGGAGPVYFSTETLAIVAPFPGAERPIYCPRCKQEIRPGTSAVKCPQCGAWHHQTEDLPCWTYGPHCALCDRKTDLSTGFQWTPEEL